ncbi:MAG: right-handed parallel beta-helix repeat-containing protein, partial [Sedimentisphaerales bacterium]|nr:right-handed parallel beta-helix repeat-containing protein [Sedimentisphaerales bacterium]
LNQAAQNGGGIAGGGTGTLTDCGFSDNRAGEQGGGMFIDEGATPLLTSCEFNNNSTDADGGGMYSHSTSDPNLVHCTFSLNQAAQNGGGIAGGGTGTISSCLFSENVATHGGGLHNDSSSVTIRHCTFYGNTADSGGGIYYDGGVSEVRNCTMVDNTADNGNALACAISADEPNDLLVTNSILWDGGNEVWHDDKAVFSVTYCDVQGGWSGVGVGNIDVDPCFVDAANSDYRLKSQAGRWDSRTYRSADFQGDGIVNLTDFAELSRYWLVTNDILQYDLNSDGIIDIVDLKIFALQFLTPGAEQGESQPYLSADFQGDGIVNLIDFAEFSRYWLMVVDDYLPYDLDRSGIVDIGDLYLFIEQYLTAGDGYWICDSVTSRCIDAGNPGSQLADEPDDGVNVRVNMGAYGATSQASKTPAGWSLLPDLNNDGIVDVSDLIIQIDDWLDNAEEQPGDLNRNGRVDLSDVALLSDDWLEY